MGVAVGQRKGQTVRWKRGEGRKDQGGSSQRLPRLSLGNACLPRDPGSCPVRPPGRLSERATDGARALGGGGGGGRDDGRRPACVQNGERREEGRQLSACGHRALGTLCSPLQLDPGLAPDQLQLLLGKRSAQEIPEHPSRENSWRLSRSAYLADGGEQKIENPA